MSPVQSSTEGDSERASQRATASEERNERGAEKLTLLEVRPRVLRLAAWFTAAVFLTVMIVAGALLRSAPTGVYFRLADQIAMVVLGVLLAAGALVFARPRLRADVEGVEVRNLLVTRRLPWAVVQGVSFPDSASWARLDLADYEYLPVLAIQASDRERAVAAIGALRELLAEHAPPEPGPNG